MKMGELFECKGHDYSALWLSPGPVPGTTKALNMYL